MLCLLKIIIKKKTIIMVAHRLSTLTNCDIIHLIKDGKIHDSGSLEELKARNKDLKKISTQGSDF